MGARTHATGEVARKREAVLLAVLRAAIGLSLVTQALQLAGMALSSEPERLGWWLLNAAVGAGFWVLLMLARRGRQRAASGMLVVILGALAATLVIASGLDNPMWPLVAAMSVVLASFLLGGRTALAVVAGTAVLALGAVLLELAPLERSPQSTDAVGAAGLVAVLGFISFVCSVFARDTGVGIDQALSHGAASSPLRQLRTKDLTLREVEVVQLVAEGHSNDAIARQLFVSTRTVQTHVANAMRKTGSENRTQLGVLALREGLAPLRPPNDDGPRDRGPSATA